MPIYMVVTSGENKRKAQQWNGRTVVEMDHIFVEMIGIFDAQQSWIDARQISYSSDFVMAESNKGLKITNPLLTLM